MVQDRAIVIMADQ